MKVNVGFTEVAFELQPERGGRGGVSSRLEDTCSRQKEWVVQKAWDGGAPIRVKE